MKHEIKNCRLLLTGASSGIGWALAEQLGLRGARLVLVARSGDKLGEICSQLNKSGAEAHVCAADITNPEDRGRIRDEVVKHLGGLDVLLNNAGVASWAHFSESSEEIMRRIMEVNFFGPAELIRLFIPLLAEGNHPAVMNVASMCARRGMPAWSEYSASKFALCGLTEALRGELVRQQIDVLMALPGLTRTGLHSNMLKSAGRARIDFASGMAPGEVARAIVQALAKGRRETVIGADARWMLRVQRFFPRLVDRLVARRVRKLYSPA